MLGRRPCGSNREEPVHQASKRRFTYHDLVAQKVSKQHTLERLDIGLNIWIACEQHFAGLISVVFASTVGASSLIATACAAPDGWASNTLQIIF